VLRVGNCNCMRSLREGKVSLGTVRRLSQNSWPGQHRATNAPSPCLSPKGRGDCETAPDKRPLPMQEGWGEADKKLVNPDRATIWTSLHLLRQPLRYAPTTGLSAACLWQGVRSAAVT